jgi:hypothetical protein
MNPNYPPKDYHALDLNQLQRISLKNRENLVSYQQFAKLPLPGASFKEFIQSLPPILAGIEFFKLVDWMFNALQQQQPIGLAMGAHVLKCGLSPLIQDLLERKIFAIVALHGAGAIHDLEFSLIGESSEDVKKELDRGQFGMAQETAFHFAQALKLTQEKQIGLGRALGLIALKQPTPI